LIVGVNGKNLFHVIKRKRTYLSIGKSIGIVIAILLRNSIGIGTAILLLRSIVIGIANTFFQYC